VEPLDIPVAGHDGEQSLEYWSRRLAVPREELEKAIAAWRAASEKDRAD